MSGSGGGRAGAAEVQRAVLMADIVSSTELYERLGDQRARELVATGLAEMDTTISAHGGRLIKSMGDGVLACFEAKTGRLIYQARLGSGFGGFTGSPVASGGKIYYVSEVGDVVVVKAGTPELKIVSRNPLGEVCLSTPAISEGDLFFRTRSHLMAISND